MEFIFIAKVDIPVDILQNSNATKVKMPFRVPTPFLAKRSGEIVLDMVLQIAFLKLIAGL